MRVAVDFGPALLIAVVIFALSSQPLRVPEALPGWSDLAAHALIFGSLAAALAWGWRRRGWSAALLGPVVTATIYGVIDEVHQAFVPGRSPAPVDVAADFVGALVAVGAVAMTRRRAARFPAQ